MYDYQVQTRCKISIDVCTSSLFNIVVSVISRHIWNFKIVIERDFLLTITFCQRPRTCKFTLILSRLSTRLFEKLPFGTMNESVSRWRNSRTFFFFFEQENVHRFRIANLT